MRHAAALATSIGGVAVAAWLGGRYGPQTPGRAAWYARLRKPSYTPPGPAIGAAWAGLDALLVLTGYRLMRRPPSRMRATALGCWGVTVAGLAGFPAMFFGRKQLGGSLAISAGMFTAAAAETLAAARTDRVAAAANVPLIAWTAFATLLSEELWRRNARPTAWAFRR